MIDLTRQRPPSQLPDANLLSLYELAKSTPPGDFLELGVYRGGSAWVLQEAAAEQGRQLHLFDTFAGIPEQSSIDLIGKGQFGDVSLEDVRAAIPGALFYVGVFPQTLGEEPSNISFAHVDCDQYESCKRAIELIWPRINAGGVIAFDDYPFEGIKKAIHDFFGKDAVQFTKATIPYVRKGAG